MSDDLRTVAAGHNGYDGAALQRFIDRIEALQADIDQIMDDAKAKCQPLRDDIKEVKDEACDAVGVTKKVLNAVIRQRRLKFRAEHVRDKLDEDQQESYDQVRHALGMLSDTPLGEAVLDQAAG